MKTALFSALTFLLFSSTIATDQPDAVLDVSGQELRTRTYYYVLPVIRGRGGGLSLDSATDADPNIGCPLVVVQEQQEVSNGLPLYFSPVNVEQQGSVVRLSTDLNVIFNASTICLQSTLWELAFDKSLQKFVVATGGALGNPGSETLNNWFKIERFEDDYKLVFCPGVCDICRPVCGELGVFVDVDGIRRLVLADEPLKVVFKRV
ncbi:putative Kunitz family trypsin and protease inhibitor protein [Hibiscus syriacus]|uniref:Kunitz family trypsin and protease inhibitor protein n=1 Tax=Hibiscus syriacus TaxID=106335 RepID=A0A6A2ZMW7_HIBSY|nr:kunitz trypsin inhibitor 5-like [Hibiscus syriacus]KAE8692896.1 putative Kunitz family trypsin and protease inhibitor protein [Hibiscus syriacus]